MGQEETEITLARQLAVRLAMPIFIVDPEGTLLFYNEAAEKILWRRFEKTGEMAASVWSRIFNPTDEHGLPLLPESLPLVIALNEHRPAHGDLWISGIDNVRRHIEVVAFPLTSPAEQQLGAIAIFWELCATPHAQLPI